MTKQPRLKSLVHGGAEFHGRARTVTGDVWWADEPQDDGSIRRHPLVPVEVIVGEQLDTKEVAK